MRGLNISSDEIDVFEIHDCFTSCEYAAISAFGLTEPGKEYKAVESGLIGCGHPVGASGVRMFHDLYKQVTERPGGYQVHSVKNGMMLNIGGVATTNFVFIVGEV